MRCDWAHIIATRQINGGWPGPKVRKHHTRPLSMNTQIEPKHLWIGQVEVRPLEGCDVLDDAKGAFVNIVTWAVDSDEFRRNAELLFDELRLLVIDVVRPEPVEVRRSREGDVFFSTSLSKTSFPELKIILTRKVRGQNDNAIVVG